MIFGIGIDLIEHDKIARLWSNHRTLVERDVLSSGERAAMSRMNEMRNRRIYFLASRISAKESVIKVLGLDIHTPFEMNEVDIRGDDHWSVILSGRLAVIAESIHVARIYGVSTRCRTVTQSTAIGESL